MKLCDNVADLSLNLSEFHNPWLPETAHGRWDGAPSSASENPPALPGMRCSISIMGVGPHYGVIKSVTEDGAFVCMSETNGDGSEPGQWVEKGEVRPVLWEDLVLLSAQRW